MRPKADKLSKDVKNYERQINKLASFIIDKVPGEPSRSEGAVDTAIRVIKQLQKERRRTQTALANFAEQIWKGDWE